MQRKKRILFVNEFSELCTGFSTYTNAILPYLYKTGKYEIAELATYVNHNDPRVDNVPWKVYVNTPTNEQEAEVYKQNPVNQFGLFKFNETCLDFQPDIIVDIRDPWMGLDWIIKSPFRKYFHFVHMATCDGEPQRTEWLQEYKCVDTLLTYSLWAKKLIAKQTGNQIIPKGVASPGTDIKLFHPMDKAAVRNRWGLDPKAKILLTVMRNQPRKLYPDLFRAFAKYIEVCKNNGNHQLAESSYLYCHTSFPDVGWDIPTELHRYKISKKVLFTYLCDNCKAVYPSFYQGDSCFCRNCQQKAAHLPNTTTGVDRKVLAEITNLANAYVQYSISEGWGMPINDAKSCGLPCFVVNYSAMTEQAFNGGAIPIPVKRTLQEPINQTNQLRVLPDDDVMAESLYDLFSNPEKLNQQSIAARKCVEQYYDWPKIAKIWESVFDDIALERPSWQSPPKFLAPNLQIPQTLNNYQFAEWCYRYVIFEPEGINSQAYHKLISALDDGYELTQDGQGNTIKVPVNRDAVLKNMLAYVQQKNNIDQYRYDRLNPQEVKTKIPAVEI